MTLTPIVEVNLDSQEGEAAIANLAHFRGLLKTIPDDNVGVPNNILGIRIYMSFK